MADAADVVVIESKASAEVQAKAQGMGWIPPERYHGELERFTDAQEYIDRGEQVLPIVRATNKRLENQVASMQAEHTALKASLVAATAALEEINEQRSVDKIKAVEEARKDLKLRLAAASEADDHAAIAEITGLMIDLKEAAKPAEKKVEPKVELKAAVVPPELKEWNEANPWFGIDKRKTALALGIAQELRDAGTTLEGVAFFNKVKEEMEATLGTGKQEPTSKVEGARGSGSGGGGSSGGKTYASLPADAKAACDADAKQFVGATKKYKTAAEWQKRYADLYFQE